MAEKATASHNPETGELLAPDPFVARKFSNLIAQIEEGVFDADASDALQDAVLVLNTAILQGRKATATVSVTLTLTANQGVVEINAKKVVKLPPEPRRRTLMYVAGGKFLSPNHPQQIEMPLRSLPSDPPKFRNAS